MITNLTALIVSVIEYILFCALQDDPEFCSGKLLSFSPGPQVRPGGIDTLQQMNQNVSETAASTYFIWFFLETLVVCRSS